MERLEQNVNKQSVGGKLFNFRPALFFALFFALGVFYAYLNKTGKGATTCLLLSLLLIPVCLFLSKRFSAVLVLLLTLFFALGVGGFSMQVERFENTGLTWGRYVVTGKIVDKKEYATSVVLSIGDLAFDGKGKSGTLVAYLSTDEAERLEISDEVIFEGLIETVTADKEAIQKGTVSDGIRFRASEISSLEKAGRTFDLFASIRVRLKERLYLGMDDEPAAVAYAVLTGDTSGIESGLLESARRGGIAHIFAVSGLHIGALYAFCRLLTDKTGFSRARFAVKWAFVAAVLLFYGGICGFSSSVLRATVMCLSTYAAAGIGVKSDGVERSGLAMLVCLFLSPASLFEAGFLLSFGACFGISVFSRTLKDLWSPKLEALFKGAGRKFGDFFAVSLSAQIFTAPLLLHFFGYASAWGILLNFLFVPLIGAVFSVLLSVAFLATVLPASLASALLFLPSALFSAILLLFHAFSFTGAAVEDLKLSFPAFASYYAAFSLASDRVNLKKRWKIFFTVLAFSAFVAVMVWVNV